MCGGDSNEQKVEWVETFNKKALESFDSYDDSTFLPKFINDVNSYIIKKSAPGTKPRVLMTSAWQLSGCVLFDLLKKNFPNIELVVLTIDTLHGFPETSRVQEQITEYFGLDVHTYLPLDCKTKEEFESKYGSAYVLSSDEFGQHSKVEPYLRGLAELDVPVTITGRRKDQGGQRKELELWEDDKQTLNPLADWTWDDITAYTVKHEIPVNELYKQIFVSETALPPSQRVAYSKKYVLDKPFFAFKKDYLKNFGNYIYVWKSIGDVHTSIPVLLDDPERSGRFFEDPNKTECGIHLVKRQKTPVAELDVVVPPRRQEPTANSAPVDPRASVEVSRNLNSFADGNTAVSHVAYALSDMLFLYPTIPSATALGAITSYWSEKNTSNIFGAASRVITMDTRSDAGAAVIGALAGGLITTVITSAPALLQMIPNIYQLAKKEGDKACVFHVAAADLSSDLTLTSTHTSLLSVKDAGVIFLNSHSVQETHDIALAAHLIAHQANIPVIHFFDQELQSQLAKVDLLNYNTISQVSSKLNKKGFPSANRGLSFNSTSKVVDQVFGSLFSVLGKKYRPFEYFGATDAEKVIISMGSGALLSQEAVDSLKSSQKKVGVLKVRLYRPWSANHFVDIIPKTVRQIIVLEQHEDAKKSRGPLYLDVLATLQQHYRFSCSTSACGSSFVLNNAQSIPSVSNKFYSVDIESLNTNVIESYLQEESNQQQKTFKDSKEYIFWDLQSDKVFEANKKLISKLSNKTTRQVQLQVATHEVELNKHVAYTQIRFSSQFLPSSTLMVTEADYVACHNSYLLKKFNVAHHVKTGGTLLLNTAWGLDEVNSELPPAVKKTIIEKDIQLYLIDANKLATEGGFAQLSHIILQSAFIRLSKVHPDVTEAETLLQQLSVNEKSTPELEDQVKTAIKCSFGSLAKVPTSSTFKDLPQSVDALPVFIRNHLQLPSSQPQVPSSDRTVISTHEAAKMLMFPDAYASHTLLRPDVTEEQTFQVVVTTNVRLTPATYDRNVFHMEMDIRGTGLKYEIGDALGVYGHNEEQEVLEFLKFYGLNPNDLLLTPVNTPSGPKKEVRSVLQHFIQVLDIFGKPGKSFYEDLAQHATDAAEKEKLLFIASSQGKEELKKRNEDTVTYADVFREFTSAHPPLSVLSQLVPAIKPRHYSIASSMKAHPDSVHLLVVRVDWVTSAGKQRVGQCTRYLSTIQVGEKMTVSIKPSVMHLPPSPETPIVMSGLGTGMAPFRAFLQERAYQKKVEGKQVGPVVLYFGSRNRASEYLYGEELEAYEQEGLLTHLRLAFSRDQKEKVYIQHKIVDDKALLCQLLQEKKGYFYLCGPTWPVSDVRDALVTSFVSFASFTPEQAAEELERMKEEGRYILEVY